MKPPTKAQILRTAKKFHTDSTPQCKLIVPGGYWPERWDDLNPYNQELYKLVSEWHLKNGGRP